MGEIGAPCGFESRATSCSLLLYVPHLAIPKAFDLTTPCGLRLAAALSTTCAAAAVAVAPSATVFVAWVFKVFSSQIEKPDYLGLH